MTTPTLTDLPLEQVRPHPQNVRRTLRGIDELAESIKSEGLHQPVVVAPDGDEAYVVVLGHSRRAAVAELGWDTIPCLVRADLDTEEKVLSAMLAENCARNDLTLVEEGDAFQRLLDLEMPAAAVAKRAGRSKKQVTDRVSVAGQSEKVRTAVEDRQLSLTDALSVAEFADDHETYAKLEAAIGTNQFGFELRTAIDIRRNLAEGERKHRAALDAGGRELDREQVPDGHHLERVWRPDEDDAAAEDMRFEMSTPPNPAYVAPQVLWWRIVPDTPPTAGAEPGPTAAATPGQPVRVNPAPPADPELEEHIDAALAHHPVRVEALARAAQTPTAAMVAFCARRLVELEITEEASSDGGTFYEAVFPGQEWPEDERYDDIAAQLRAEVESWGPDRAVTALWVATEANELGGGRYGRWWWRNPDNRRALREVVEHLGYELHPSEAWLLERFDREAADGDADA